MYSYENRIRAVKLYIKLGNRTRPTIRRLGYPTKNARTSLGSITYVGNTLASAGKSYVRYRKIEQAI